MLFNDHQADAADIWNGQRELVLISDEIPGDDPDSDVGNAAKSNAPDRTRPSATIRGKVSWSGSGQGVSGATVLIVSGPGPAPDIAPITDDEGWFELDGLLPGSWHLRAVSPDGEQGEASASVPTGSTVEIEIAARTYGSP